jgi:hypothetical protein
MPDIYYDAARVSDAVRRLKAREEEAFLSPRSAGWPLFARWRNRCFDGMLFDLRKKERLGDF